MTFASIRAGLLLSTLALAPTVAQAASTPSQYSKQQKPETGYLTSDDVEIFRALLQALDVVRLVHADEDSLAYLGSSARGNTFRLTLSGKPWLVEVAVLDREAQMAGEILAAKYAGDRGWGPKVMPVPQKPSVLLTEYVTGTVLRPEQLNDDDLTEIIVNKLAAVHSEPCAAAPLPQHEMVSKARAMRAAFIDAGLSGPVDDAAIQARLGVLEAQLQMARPMFRTAHQDMWHGNVRVTATNEVALVNWGSLSCNEPFIDIAKLALLADLTPQNAMKLLQNYLHRAPTQGERLRYATVMGILEIDYYFYVGTHGDAADAHIGWPQLTARLQASLARPLGR